MVVDPSDYEQLLEALKPGSSPEEALAFRKRLAWKAYQHTASYDSQAGGGRGGGCGVGGGRSRSRTQLPPPGRAPQSPPSVLAVAPAAGRPTPPA